ncbi:MAG: hypothetical protein WHS89_08210 [Acidimicrobiales bacterium]|nr:hypothetical protein [Rhabdothermincola sediminis]
MSTSWIAAGTVAGCEQAFDRAHHSLAESFKDGHRTLGRAEPNGAAEPKGFDLFGEVRGSVTACECAEHLGEEVPAGDFAVFGDTGSCRVQQLGGLELNGKSGRVHHVATIGVGLAKTGGVVHDIAHGDGRWVVDVEEFSDRS